MFAIEFAPRALRDYKWFSKKDQKTIWKEIEKHLRHQPLVEARNRKRLRAKHVSERELRVGNFRIFYDVDSEAETPLVTIAAIGYKVGNKLFFRGKEYSS